MCVVKLLPTAVYYLTALQSALPKSNLVTTQSGAKLDYALLKCFEKLVKKGCLAGFPQLATAFELPK